MKTSTFQVGAILDSVKALEVYHEATGKVPPRIPEGKNTYRIPFTVHDGKAERAALLISQRGFELTAEEAANGEEANGLSVMVALDAPNVEEGHALLLDWTDEMLHLKRKEAVAKAASARGGRRTSAAKTDAARANGRLGGRPRKAKRP